MDLTEINRLVLDAQSEMTSFSSGRQAAATRARKSLLQLKKQSDLLRKQILEQQKNKKATKQTKQPKADAIPVADTAEPVQPVEPVEPVGDKKKKKSK